jgi:hypothetical protein
LSECSEGTGSPEFTDKLRTYAGPESYLAEITETAVIPDQWQSEKLALTEPNHELFFYTPGVVKEQIGVLAANSYANAEAAVAAFLLDLPENAQVAVIPEGTYAFARVQSEPKANPEPALTSSFSSPSRAV